MSHELRSIKIAGYKSIKSADVEIGNMNVLIGQNGAGKTNFIQVFAFLKNVIAQQLHDTVMSAGGANNIVFGGVKMTNQILLEINMLPNYYGLKLRVTGNGGLYITNETIGYNLEDDIRLDPKWELNLPPMIESFLKSVNTSYGKNTYEALTKWNIYHFHDTSATARVKQSSKTYDVERLHDDAGNLAAFLYMLRNRHPEHYDRIIKEIQLVLPQFDDFYLVPFGAESDNVQLFWKAKGHDQILSPSALSDGSLRFICLTVLLLQPNLPKLILIDEPELGLHPIAIMYLGAMLRRAAKEVQVIVSTQSVNLVNEFEAEDIIVVNHTNQDGTTFKRLSSDDLSVWLEEYTMGDIWQRNLIGGQP